MFLGGGIHIVDLLLWLTGDPVTEVLAAHANRIATAASGFEHPDLVTATLRTESGALMKVNANLGSVGPHFHALRLYGTEGTFVNGLPDGVLHTEGAERARRPTPYPGVGKDVLIGSFLDAILTGEPAEVTARDVFATLSVCIAVEESLERRRGRRRSTISYPRRADGHPADDPLRQAHARRRRARRRGRRAGRHHAHPRPARSRSSRPRSPSSPAPRTRSPSPPAWPRCT